MPITRIEIESDAGRVTIERQPGRPTILIYSLVRQPPPGEMAWESWEIPADADDHVLLQTARDIQCRADGVPGTDRMVGEYLHNLRCFID